jgi:saccharopine dehydrogenase-like NADP-dependent oxidoreductase
MTKAQRVLILGGTGRIGRQVAADIVAHTPATVQIAGRDANAGAQVCAQLGQRAEFLSVDVASLTSLAAAIAPVSGDSPDLVIHCAGPFHHRDEAVLQQCIQHGINYVDVSDHPSYTRKAIAYRPAAQQAGITAIINTGIFPGISNSMVRLDVEQLDNPETIHLSYIVAGSGGAGLTVMRTTFLGLQNPFQAWCDGAWKTIQPYSSREQVEFPPPYGRSSVYWFDMPETFTLPQTFPVRSVVTKFGTVPDLYNLLTWTVARGWHPWLLRQPPAIEFLSRVSYAMTQVSDRLSGVGVAIRSEVTGLKDSQPTRVVSTLVQEHTAIAAGYGTGGVAQLLLSGQLDQPGVWVVEQALPSALFLATLHQRGVQIHQQILPL